MVLSVLLGSSLFIPTELKIDNKIQGECLYLKTEITMFHNSQRPPSILGKRLGIDKQVQFLISFLFVVQI